MKSAARRARAALWPLPLVLLLPLFAACPPAPSDPSGTGGAGGGGSATGGATGCAEAPMMLATTCVGGQCHSPGAGEGRPDFVTPGELEKMIGMHSHEGCPSMPTPDGLLINTTKPASGVIFERLSADPLACYKQMPPLDAPPSQQLDATKRAALVTCLKSWVESKLK